jgi:hypothetical protein
MEDILEFCGYKSVSDLLNDHMTESELSYLFVDLLNSPEDATDFIKEEVERIAKDIFEWVDHEKMKADADEEAYQRYRDGD